MGRYANKAFMHHQRLNMSDEDLLDKAFDLVENKTKWLYQNDLIKNWFNIISWTTLTAVVFVMAKHLGSYFLGSVGVISFILVFFYGWHSLHENVKEHLKITSKYNRIALISLVFIGVSAPAGLLYYMFQAVAFLVDKRIGTSII